MKRIKLRVLFDAGPIVNSQKSGVGYYTYQLIEALASNFPNELELVGHYFNFLGRKKPVLPTGPNIRYKSSRLLPGKVLSVLRRIGLQLPFDLLIKTRGDIVLFPNFASLPLLQSAKKAVVIHDLCFEDYPNYLQRPNREFLKKFVPRSVREADLVITISSSTEKAMQKHYGINKDKVLITPIPPAKPYKAKVAKPKGLLLPKKFILFVSTLEPRKNYINLVWAYAKLPPSLKAEYGLVLAGGIGWDTEEPMAEINQLQEAGEKIIVTGYISESDRAYLYQNASLLVSPSHYEGFGMPLLEAMSYGVPVAASNIAVFHEVAGDAAVYFDKDSLEDIASKIETILSGNETRDKLLRNADNQLKKYNWTKVAATVKQEFSKLLEIK
jgi:glycosyltransferase involved in cell wall biosynthesis